MQNGVNVKCKIGSLQSTAYVYRFAVLLLFGTYTYIYINGKKMEMKSKLDKYLQMTLVFSVA